MCNLPVNFQNSLVVLKFRLKKRMFRQMKNSYGYYLQLSIAYLLNLIPPEILYLHTQCFRSKTRKLTLKARQILNAIHVFAFPSIIDVYWFYSTTARRRPCDLEIA